MASQLRTHSYRLNFHACEMGIGKVVEYFAPDLSYAFQLVGQDASRRDVDIWQDGLLVCSARHGLEGIEIRQADLKH